MLVNRTAILIAILMFTASIGAIFARPTTKIADTNAVSLEQVVPKQFGEWREEPQRFVQVVNPQTKQGAARQALQRSPQPGLREFFRLPGDALARLW